MSKTKYKREIPPQTILRKLISYNPETGEFFWKYREFDDEAVEKSWNTQHAGKQIKSTAGRDGFMYLVIIINHVAYPAARIAFMYEKGDVPQEVAYKDGNLMNLKMENLLPTTPERSCQRKRKAKRKALPKGVTYRKDRGSYTARIFAAPKPGMEKKLIKLGEHKSITAARLAYANAAKSLFINHIEGQKP